MSHPIYRGEFPAGLPANYGYPFTDAAAETCPECHGQVYVPYTGADGGAFPVFCTADCPLNGESDLVIAARYYAE